MFVCDIIKKIKEKYTHTQISSLEYNALSGYDSDNDKKCLYEYI